jgi:predicted dehydrogenase
MAKDTIRIGIAGACARGGSFKAACEAHERLEIRAVCDVDEDRLEETRQRLGAAEKYVDYAEMLDRGELDAVIVGTPMQLHVPQSVAALERNLHVLSEVPAGVSVEECRDLVRAANASQATYVMAENYIYRRPCALVKALVEAGLFGTPYFAEGEYLHELKALGERTTWRRHWQNGIDGITYGTHSLGPILHWLADDRVESVCCAGSGVHYVDPRGDPYAQDTSVMLGKLRSGGLVKVRVDMISDRPHAMTNYQLQGTDGCYESARAEGERDRVWLRATCEDPNAWLDAESVMDEFLPAWWREAGEAARQAGHGGGDWFEVLDWVRHIDGEAEAPGALHRAMDMTLPGLVSQQSIREGGRWIDVPDSREW